MAIKKKKNAIAKLAQRVTNIKLRARVNIRCLTKKAEPPPTRDVNRDSGTASANGGWLRRLVRLLAIEIHIFRFR